MFRVEVFVNSRWPALTVSFTGTYSANRISITRAFVELVESCSQPWKESAGQGERGEYR